MLGSSNIANPFEDLRKFFSISYLLSNVLRYFNLFTNSATILDIQTVLSTSQKLKFSIMDFFSKCDQIRGKLSI